MLTAQYENSIRLKKKKNSKTLFNLKYYQYKTITIPKEKKKTVLIEMVRSGHKKITHRYLMAKEHPLPTYKTCVKTLSIKHILSECLHYSNDPFDHTTWTHRLDQIQRSQLSNY